jgi:hypothetical protein
MEPFQDAGDLEALSALDRSGPTNPVRKTVVPVGIAIEKRPVDRRPGRERKRAQQLMHARRRRQRIKKLGAPSLHVEADLGEVSEAPVEEGMLDQWDAEDRAKVEATLSRALTRMIRSVTRDAS